jgi:energy-coupling factor transporter ATP-binding protein EcfA2
MKIRRIRIIDFQQFKDLNIDLTNPENGKSLDKVCLIGSNGTGKSTLLSIINSVVHRIKHPFPNDLEINIFIEIEIDQERVYFLKTSQSPIACLINPEIDKHDDWLNVLIKDFNKINKYSTLVYNNYPKRYDELVRKLSFNDNDKDLFIYSPSESHLNNVLHINDVPESNLQSALELFNHFPYYHNVTNENISEFWKTLIYLVKKRDNEREIYENSEININKTKKQLIEEFEKVSPKILERLSVLWNKILDKAKLEFDVKNASNPIQLTENLRAYIKIQGKDQRIAYNQLSTGIRNYIFRIGHIFSLIFNRDIAKGFLLIDEPENSLFPDFLLDLIDNYQEVLIDRNNEINTQSFYSTHNPIIASQFQSYERIILEFDEDGYVFAKKGVTPVGDDPNDILIKDFEIRSLLTKEGLEKWDRYLELKTKIKSTSDQVKKSELLDEYIEIGNSYNFPLNDLSK